MKHLDSHTIVKLMSEPEFFVLKNVRKVYQSVAITQIGEFEFVGQLVTRGSCCISKGEGGG